MAATFIKKLVMIITKNAIPIIKKKPLELWNIISHFTAIHLAAPVCQRQNPMLMAPAKSRMIFHGISSRSSIFRMPVIKKRIVDEFPSNYEDLIYVEPFIGAGHVYFYKEKIRLTLDYQEDLDFFKELIEHVKQHGGII